MPFSLKTILMATSATCLLTFSAIAQGQISPDIMNLLIVAAEKDNGANLDMVARIAIAANPAATKDIQDLVANLRQKMPKKPLIKTAPVVEKKPVVTIETKVEEPGYFNFAGWDGEVELNFLRSSGNTSQESLGLGGKLKRDADKFHHIITAFFDLNKNTSVKDKQKWGLAYKLNYDFSGKLYLTGFAGYENDQFGAFRERITTSFGIGYPIIKTDKYSWKVEGGPSVLFTKELPGQSYSTSINAFASSIFGWTINERSEFTNTTIFYFGEKSVLESKSALKVKINGALSSKFSYDILYDRDAPLGRAKTDTVARAGLLYDF
ncbi:MAG: DUF481 domain-containing protein [Emcibacter sp.]|nr:DUF481 domain-containing protein [Emcibacter sp.]MBL4894322.1 DUF481 domain-containing protein [Emcibacter sp.]